MRDNLQLNAKCRDLVTQHEGTLKYIAEEVLRETEAQRIEGETAFEYAKLTIRKQSMKEGIDLFLKKINKYADKQ